MFNTRKQIAKSGLFTTNYRLYSGLWYTFDDNYNLKRVRLWENGIVAKDSLMLNNQ